jgi:putative aldouronate transport system substrate-binding protein
MKKTAKTIFVSLIVLLALIACEGRAASGGDGPVRFTITYSDNPTLPFKQDWLVVTESNKLFNVNATWEAIPSTDYNTKILAELNDPNTKIDVMLFLLPTAGDAAKAALDGAIAPISDYVERGWCPNFSKRITDWNMKEELDLRRLSDGKYYFLPCLTDKPFYDGGLLIREDLLEEFKMATPKTFDDFYRYMKACKERDPSCYPLTNLVQPYVTFRMTMPSWGISLGGSSSTGTYVLSWDYDRKEFFAGGISEQYRDYLRYLNKLYAEGLYDPEFVPEGDMWAIKMSTGAATASYAYYDQIGGVHANSEIKGIRFNMIPPLAGPYGAYHQPKARMTNGVIFTTAAQKRPDFEKLVRAVDEMFYSDAAIELWCLGKEGVTFTRGAGGKTNFIPEAVNSLDGVYKYLQVNYGMGAASSQMIWLNAQEMLKYDQNYADINAIVARMNGIPLIPPAAALNEIDTERASILRATLRDTFDIWNDDFTTGKKSLNSDWDAYVKEMRDLGIDEFLAIYNRSKR